MLGLTNRIVLECGARDDRAEIRKVIMRVLAHISAKYYKLLQMLPLG